MQKFIGKKAGVFLAGAALAVSGVFMGSSASAQGDLYFMHNASAYYVWSNLSVCESDLSRSGHTCISWGGPKCGRNIWSNSAPLDVAKYRIGRNDSVILRHTNGNSKFCTLEPN